MSRLKLTPHGREVAKELRKRWVNTVEHAERNIRRRREQAKERLERALQQNDASQ